VGLNAWNAPWIPTVNGFKPTPRVEGVPGNLWIFDLILENPRRWNKDKVGEFLDHFSAEQVCRIQLSQNLHEDKLMWHPSSTGILSTKLVYWTNNDHQFVYSGPLSN
jgi:hypothetical protein